MKGLIDKWYQKWSCKHHEAVTLKEERGMRTEYCSKCDSFIYTNLQKWWQR